jgi:SAM-dependent methyltransferase
MENFWEKNFIEKQIMWGFEASESAYIVKDFFIDKGIKDILIPGVGYGRNARLFVEYGINVTGIEISKTAIELAFTKNDLHIPIFHGSVTDMPFDNKIYDGIFSYALIHLLNNYQRKKFIHDCFNQLKSGGFMFFSTISKNDLMYGKGKIISKDRFEITKGVNVFFFDEKTILKEFADYGFIDFLEIEEAIKFDPSYPPMKFLLIKCQKNL